MKWYYGVYKTYKEHKSNFVLEDYQLFVLGDGIETNTKDFKEEVASQLTSSSWVFLLWKQIKLP